MWALLVLLGFFLLAILIAHVILQAQKRTECDIHYTKEVCVYPVQNIEFCSSAAALHNKMLFMIQDAKREVMICTYRWRMDTNEENIVHGHIAHIGLALSHLSPNVSVKILCNQMALRGETDRFVAREWAKTLTTWQNLFHYDGSNIEFRAWRHIGLDNIHDKFVIVDDQLFLIHSMNVEGYSHGLNDTSWLECGVYFETKHSFPLRDHFNENFEQGHVIKPIFDKNIVAGTRWKPLTQTQLSNIKTAPLVSKESAVDIVYKSADAFCVSRTNDVIVTLYSLLQTATKTICILTPNFNDIALLRACLDAHQQGAMVRVVFSKGFNVDVPFLQQALCGWSTNEQMISSNPMDFVHLLKFRWHAKKGQPIIGKTASQLHAKMFLIDDCFLITGSVNADVYSTITSSETCAVVKDATLATNVRKEFFEPIWTDGIDVL